MQNKILILTKNSDLFAELTNELTDISRGNQEYVQIRECDIALIQHFLPIKIIFLDNALAGVEDLDKFVSYCIDGNYCDLNIVVETLPKVSLLSEDKSFTLDYPLERRQVKWLIKNAEKFLNRTVSRKNDIRSMIFMLASLIQNGKEAEMLGLAQDILKLLYPRFLEIKKSNPNPFMSESVNMLFTYLYMNRQYLRNYVVYDDVCRIDWPGGISEEEFRHLALNKVKKIYGIYQKFIPQSKNPIIEPILIYMLENVEWHSLSLNEISDIFYISKYYLSRLFKKETGVTLLQYATFIKLEHAKILLSDTSMKITEIRQCLSYEDTAYFSKLFKKYTGVSALEYRNQYLQNKVRYKDLK